jgi:malonate-semialdehyde dehydrogenase (acetylating)/methylmalonate-semialdehyde dehydrogenase
VPESTDEEMEAAVAAAKAAFPEWSDTSVSVRSRIMFKLQELIREHTDEMADVITVELGKVTADAKGDIFRGLEIVEQSCAMGQTMLGDTLGNVSANMDTVMIRQPLGVCAGITPFNFPAMIPLWMFPVAVTTGNTFVMKVSEIDPGVPMMLAQLAKEAGLPDGALRCVVLRSARILRAPL